MINRKLNQAIGQINYIKNGQAQTVVDGRVYPIMQSLGITMSGTIVTGNQTNAYIDDLQTRLATLEDRLTNYENHTHSYIDSTINDTSDGTGTQTDTTKTTGIVD